MPRSPDRKEPVLPRPIPTPLLAPLLALALIASAPPVAAAGAPQPPTRLVRVTLDPAVPLERLLEGGFDLVSVKRQGWADLYVHPGDEARLRAMGAALRVLDDSVEAHYAARAARELSARPRPRPARVTSAARGDGVFRAEDLPPFGSGSMGGYWTTAEIKMKLDSLVASDTRDLVADRLDTLGTSIEGRPIWGLRIGRRVDPPDTRPAVYLNALTHAREPEGMQSLFRFVDDLLGRYDTDPFARYLLDHRVLYVCPLVNPDGYAWNEANWPAGGGSWRKNRRNNGTSYGVDLNRNFGYQWGYDNLGSSGTPSNETYRGTSAFSEPETRAQRDVVVALQPVMGISYHTYGQHWLNPWGYVPQSPPDSAAFREWDDLASAGTPYITGTGSTTLYVTNGDFNDWTYGDVALKPRCFSWTPEIGTDDDGFWPAPSRIVPLADENLWKGYVVAAIAGPFVRVESSALAWGELVAGQATALSVRARNAGWGATPAHLSATLVALDAGVRAEGPGVPYPALAARTSADAEGGATFSIAADDTVTPGRLVRFEADFRADDGYFSRDTVEVLVGHPTVRLLDACESTAAWMVSAGWGPVSGDPGHPDRYLGDSPAGNYPNYANLRLVSKARLDLSEGVHAWALFEARWTTEQTYDGTIFEASLDSVTWTPLRGRSTTASVFTIAPGLPVYQARRFEWAPERVDLSPFAGPGASRVAFRVRTFADGYTNYGGFDLDSLRVLLFDPAQQPVPTAVGPPAAGALALAPPWPNPARGAVRIRFTLPRAGAASLAVHDVTGRRVRTLAARAFEPGTYAMAWDLQDEAAHPVPPGLYLARLQSQGRTITQRIVVLH